MRCEHCGSPIDRRELERGECASCGTALRPREAPRAGPAPLSDATADATAAQHRTTVGVLIASAATALVGGALAFSIVGRPAARAPAPNATTTATASSAPAAVPPEDSAPAREVDVPALGRADAGVSRPSGGAPKASVERVVAANKGAYDRCQREEVAQNPNAPRRYSVAVTVDGSGRTEWVEVLSEASPTMKSCIESVTRGLAFPRAATGSERSIVALSFGADRR